MAYSRSDRRSRSRRRSSNSGGGGVFSQFLNNAGVPLAFAGGFVGNLAEDIADSVVGLPMGLVNLAKDPIKSVKVMGKSMAHTWSPLVTGHPLKFAEQVYDHPLAPILDVATVFTLGAGSAVRGAKALSSAGIAAEGGRIAKVGKLTQPRRVRLEAPKGVIGPAYEKSLSPRAGRRLMQEMVLKIDQAGHLPSWYRTSRYNKAKLTDMAHRTITAQVIEARGLKGAAEIEKAVEGGNRALLDEYVANRLQAEAIFQGADALMDIGELGKRARSVIPAHMHASLARHAYKTVDETEVQHLLTKHKISKGARSPKKRHYALVKDPAYMDRGHLQLLAKEERRHSTLTRRNSNKNLAADVKIQRLEELAAKYKQDADDVVRLEDEARQVANEITRLREQGHIATAGTELAGEWPDLLRGYRKEIRLKRAGAEKYQRATNLIEELKQAKSAREGQIAESWSRIEAARNRSAERYFDYAGESYDSLTSTVEHFGQHATTTDLSQALRGPNGEYHVVPLHDAYNLAWEGGNSLKFLHKLIHTPTVLWKQAVLLYTPRIVTNNGVGNWFLYAVRNPNGAGMKALYDTLRHRYGDGFDAVFPTDHWLYRYFGDEMLADAFHIGADVGLGPTSTAGGSAWLGRGEALAKKARGGFAGVQYRIAEKPVRAASIRAALYKMPEVKEELARLRAKGMEGPKALDHAIENVMKARPDLREAAALESRRVAGDYVTLREGEKFARDIIPFYLWQRHIVKTTGNMFLDQPLTLNVMSNLSEMGIDELRDELGDLPNFLRGVVPLAALGFGDKPGRANVLLTSSLNPFATVGDMADAVEAWSTGRKRKGAAFTGLGISPFLTVPIEQMTGTSLLTGAPKDESGGVAGGTLKQILESLPYAKTLDALTGERSKTSPSGKDYLYAHDIRGPATWLTGFTIRDLSLEAAAAIAAKEHKTPVPRRRRSRRRR